MTEITEPRSGWSSLPRWARLGLVVALAVVVALAAVVAVRLATRVPPIPTGMTDVDDLRPGSCLEESAPDLERYTVVPCDQEHPQQVFATADLEMDEVAYTAAGGALQKFGDQVCDRYREYRLFLDADLERNDYEVFAIAVPTAADFESGDTEALCVITPKEGELTEDLYRPMS